MRGTLVIAAITLLVAGCARVDEDGWDVRVDVPYDPGYDPGWDPGYDPGWDPGYDPGWDPGTDPGVETGTDPGWDPGTDPGADPGYDPGADPGYDPGTDPGYDPGTDPGLDGPPGIIWCVPDTPTSCTSYSYGCCPASRLFVHCYAGLDFSYSCYGGLIGYCSPGIGGYMECL